MKKQVFEKVAAIGKTELSEVKVELALVDDLKKAAISALKELTRAEGEKKKVVAAIDAVKTSYRQNAIQSKQVLDMFSQVETQAKSLGLEIPADLMKLKTDAQANEKMSMDKVKSLIDIVKSL